VRSYSSVAGGGSRILRKKLRIWVQDERQGRQGKNSQTEQEGGGNVCVKALQNMGKAKFGGDDHKKTFDKSNSGESYKKKKKERFGRVEQKAGGAGWVKNAITCDGP